MYMYMFIYVCVYTHAHTHTHARTHTHTHTCVSRTVREPVVWSPVHTSAYTYVCGRASCSPCLPFLPAPCPPCPPLPFLALCARILIRDYARLREIAAHQHLNPKP